MRVLHLGKYYAPERGGIERYTQTLAEWCAAQGDIVAVLVHQRPGRWRGTCEQLNGVEVHRAGCLAAPVYTPLSPAFPFELSRTLREFRPDLLHLHFPNPSCFAALAIPAARRLPWIVHWHADVPPDSPDWRLRTFYRAYRPFERAVLRRANAIIATSQPYVQASAALAEWKDKVHVVALGIDADATTTPTAHAPEHTRWNEENASALRLLAVGRLSRYKGFDVLIEALARVPAASLLLVGHGECERELRAQASARGLGQRLRFAGNLDDGALAAAYAEADAFVLPSLDRGEAFGLVLLEAMRAGLPTIASAIPGSGVGSVVVDGETGLLVPPGNVGALAAAIERLRDSALRRQLGQAGVQRWRSTFTLEATASAVRRIYAEAVAARAPA
ncbi:glycosyltransferase [Dokdonella sp.]|uniref:glycosyltransferase n=1 Tax=Dokdonella sp. TaxID=2291710 RepID=UPI001B05AB12|nr:glycosyltransferase [Dokdonella sp.]MBO9662352.1 glycosyltransferase [Dokdonella sp.]